MKGPLTSEIIEALRPRIESLVREIVAERLADDDEFWALIRERAAEGRPTFSDEE